MSIVDHVHSAGGLKYSVKIIRQIRRTLRTSNLLAKVVHLFTFELLCELQLTTVYLMIWFSSCLSEDV